MELFPLLLLARITKPHGIKGDFCVEYYADSLEYLTKPLFLRNGKLGQNGKNTRINGASHGSPIVLVNPPCQPAGAEGAGSAYGSFLTLHIKGVEDRNKAETLRGMEICIEKHYLPEPEDDDYYVDDLVGMEIALSPTHPLYNTSKPIFGVLEDVQYPADKEVWTIRATSGEEVLFPAVPEFVELVDEEEGRIVICPPEGLLEIYLES